MGKLAGLLAVVAIALGLACYGFVMFALSSPAWQNAEVHNLIVTLMPPLSFVVIVLMVVALMVRQ